MKRILGTLLATFALLIGGLTVTAAPASAATTKLSPILTIGTGNTQCRFHITYYANANGTRTITNIGRATTYTAGGQLRIDANGGGAVGGSIRYVPQGVSTIYYTNATTGFQFPTRPKVSCLVGTRAQVGYLNLTA